MKNLIIDLLLLSALCVGCTHEPEFIADTPKPEDTSVVYGGDWYKPSKNGPYLKISDRTFQTEWWKLYKDYVAKKTRDADFDYTEFCLVDIDDNGVPELLLGAGCMLSAFTMLTIYDNKVYSSPKDYFYSYIPGKGIIHCHARFRNNECGCVYQVKSGMFETIFSYEINDDELMDKADLPKDLQLTCEEDEDGKVWAKTAWLDGKMYYVSLYSQADARPIMNRLDEVYFSKGNSLRIRSEWYDLDTLFPSRMNQVLTNN